MSVSARMQQICLPKRIGSPMRNGDENTASYSKKCGPVIQADFAV